jgi:signal transduction histidine kinase
MIGRALLQFLLVLDPWARCYVDYLGIMLIPFDLRATLGHFSGKRMNAVCTQTRRISGKGELRSCRNIAARSKCKFLHDIVALSLLLFAAWWCFLGCIAEARVPSRKNVLLVPEAGNSNPATQVLTPELQTFFHGNPDFHLASYVYKYPGHKVDAFVAIGPESIRLIAASPTAPGFFMFDGKRLKRWHVREASLPQGDIFMFREQSLWEDHRLFITAIGFVVTILLFLTVYSWFKTRQLQLAKNSLIKLSGMLIDSEEKERRRLASELHDDFSQRMALLSIGLETAEEMITREPHRACQKIHELIDSASEIGADLHTVSHRLHSSTLERLGLVPGVSSFCKEFAAQQGVQVDFLHGNIGRNISPDIALCLFRIVQEALRNVKKHSGVTQAQVTLKVEAKTLCLSVRDQGIGFEMNFNDCRGLGLLSMAERCRLHGGELKVISRPHKGTTVDARLPLQSRHEEMMHVTETRSSAREKESISRLAGGGIRG